MRLCIFILALSVLRQSACAAKPDQAGTTVQALDTGEETGEETGDWSDRRRDHLGPKAGPTPAGYPEGFGVVHELHGEQPPLETELKKIEKGEKGSKEYNAPKLHKIHEINDETLAAERAELKPIMSSVGPKTKSTSKITIASQIKHGWTSLTGSVSNAKAAPAPPPEGSPYFRFLEYDKADTTCISKPAPKLLMEGVFPEGNRPKKSKTYCFPDSFPVNSSDENTEQLTVAISCDNYCIAEGKTDVDRPVAGPCKLLMYKAGTADCKAQDKVGETQNWYFNKGCTPQHGDDGVITSHAGFRCHNCCSGVGQIAVAWLVVFLAVTVNIVSQF